MMADSTPPKSTTNHNKQLTMFMTLTNSLLSNDPAKKAQRMTLSKKITSTIMNNPKFWSYLQMTPHLTIEQQLKSIHCQICQRCIQLLQHKDNEIHIFGKLLFYKLTENNDTFQLLQTLSKNDEKIRYMLQKYVCNPFQDLLNENDISLIDMVSMDQDLTNIYNSFMSTVDAEIVNIFKIEKNFKENTLIYDNILKTKENKTEDMLFHGSSFKNIKNIIYNGFNRDFNKRAAYGRGTYFAKHANKAYQYVTKDENGYYAMLVCRVFVGNYGIQRRGRMSRNRRRYNYNNKNNQNHYTNTMKDDESHSFDSMVNDKSNPTIFVINKDYHAVPLYIIMCKDKVNKIHTPVPMQLNMPAPPYSFYNNNTNNNLNNAIPSNVPLISNNTNNNNSNNMYVIPTISSVTQQHHGQHRYSIYNNIQLNTNNSTLSSFSLYNNNNNVVTANNNNINSTVSSATHQDQLHNGQQSYLSRLYNNTNHTLDDLRVIPTVSAAETKYAY